jgi:hypothetical protein
MLGVTGSDWWLVNWDKGEGGVMGVGVMEGVQLMLTW